MLVHQPIGGATYSVLAVGGDGLTRASGGDEDQYHQWQDSDPVTVELPVTHR